MIYTWWLHICKHWMSRTARSSFVFSWSVQSCFLAISLFAVTFLTSLTRKDVHKIKHTILWMSWILWWRWCLLIFWSPESLEGIARFTCSSLQNVNLYGCRLLRPAGFASILETAVSLRELRCGGCDRLERLEIPQSSLVRVEAQGCSSLRRHVLQQA